MYDIDQVDTHLDQGVPGTEELQRKCGALSHFGYPDVGSAPKWARSSARECLFILLILLITLLLAVLFHKLLKDPGPNRPELSMILHIISLPGLRSRQLLPILEIILIDDITLVESDQNLAEQLGIRSCTVTLRRILRQHLSTDHLLATVPGGWKWSRPHQCLRSC